ncbi:MAG: PIG-L family deacetylase [Chloroflexota bacterium]
MPLHIYLSPHLDDAVLSCGGLIANQVAEGNGVTVLTVFAGDPGPGPLSDFAQALHQLWGGSPNLVGDRRTEDRLACGRLGASVVHMLLPDAIYRHGPDAGVRYASEEAIFGPLHPRDLDVLEEIHQRLSSACPPEAVVYCPLGLGFHVDHRLTRAAAERLGRPLWYYQDFPYAARGGEVPAELGPPPGREHLVPLSPEEIESWAAAIAEYRSQVPMFWSDVYALYEEIRRFHDGVGGVRLIAPADEGTALSSSSG